MRSTSATFKAAVNAQNTDAAFLVELTIAHSSITTLSFVNARQDVSTLGATFTAFPFEITLPADFDDELPRVQISIDMIDQSIIAELRGLVGPPTISIQVVLADDDTLVYDTIEAGPFELALRHINYDDMVITGDLQSEDLLNEPFPGWFYTPQTAPGLWS